MASITITIPSGDVNDVAEAYGVTSTSEFKTIILKQIKAKTLEYKNQKQMRALTPASEPNLT